MTTTIKDSTTVEDGGNVCKDGLSPNIPYEYLHQAGLHYIVLDSQLAGGGCFGERSYEMKSQLFKGQLKHVFISDTMTSLPTCIVFGQGWIILTNAKHTPYPNTEPF